MKNKLDWIAIIPARAGSKRLANKNLLKLGELSLVEIAVKKAIRSSVFDKVIISSDSQEIIDKAKVFGAEALGGLRKKELSGDNAKTIDVIKDLLNMQELSSVVGFTLIQCTSPFTSIETLAEVTKIAKINRCSSISIKKIEHSYLEWILVKENEYIKPAIDKNSSSSKRSQDATPIYSPSGNAYAVNKEYFFSHNDLIGPRSIPYFISDKNELIDIDDIEDFKSALSAYKNNDFK